MLKSNYLLSLLLTTHILGITASHPNALQQPEALRNAIDEPSSSNKVAHDLTPTPNPGGETLTVTENVTVIKDITVTTCPSPTHQVPTPSNPSSIQPPTSTPCAPTPTSKSSTPSPTPPPTSTPCPTSTPPAPPPAAPPNPNTTISTNIYTILSSSLCATGWQTFTHTITSLTTKTCTPNPWTPLLTNSPNISTVYIAPTTAILAGSLPCSTNGEGVMGSEGYCGPRSTSLGVVVVENGTGVVRGVMGLLGIGFVVWVMVVL